MDEAPHNNRAVGHTITSYQLIHHAPLTPAQTAWNHRVIEMMRLRLGQRLAIHIVRLTNAALTSALHPETRMSFGQYLTSIGVPLTALAPR